MTTNNIPERIWLQVHGDADPEIETGPINWDEVSWCRDMVFDTDVEYVRVKDSVTANARAREAAENVKRLLEIALWSK